MYSIAVSLLVGQNSERKMGAQACAWFAALLGQSAGMPMVFAQSHPY